MSVRGLAVVALLLGALCAGAGFLLADRLGWCGVEPPAEWTFVNPTLDVVRGQRVVLRPILEGVPSLRYTFLATILEPAADDEVAPVPHLRAGVEEWSDDEWRFRPPVASLVLCQLGALTAQEWLQEIRPVREVRGERGDRMLLKAVFGHRSGAVVTYYHDPSQRVPAVGWTRCEMVAEGQMPEINFASDGGVN